MALERTYNIPLRKEWLKVAKYERAKKAIKAVRQFLARHMRTDIENVKLSKWINQAILARGYRKPPHHIKIKVVKADDNIVKAELQELPKEALEEMKREEEKNKEQEKKAEKKEEEGGKAKETEEIPSEEKEKEKMMKREVAQVKHEMAAPKQKQQNVPLRRKALQK